MSWVTRWRSKVRWLLAIISGRPVYDGNVIYWHGETLRHRGWVYAMPVDQGNRYYRAGLNCTRLLLPDTSDCILVRPLQLSEVRQAGVVYGLVVELEDNSDG